MKNRRHAVRPYLEHLEDRTVPTTLSQITNALAGDSENAVINGDGTRIAFESTSNPTGQNADGSNEIFLFDTVTRQTRQLTSDPSGSSFFNLNPLSMNADGTRIAFFSYNDYTSQNFDRNAELFLFDLNTNELKQITSTATDNGTIALSISGDGTRIGFSSDGNFTGQNGDGSFEIFVFDVASSQFTQITNSVGAGSSTHPVMNADGTRIAFDSTHNLTGQNADGSQELFLFDMTTQQLTQITNDPGGLSAFAFYPSINADGTRIAFSSDNDPLGQNADGSFELFLFDTNSQTFTQITDFDAPGIIIFDLSINSAGTKIAFESAGDHTGQNGDGSSEIFLFDAISNRFTQLTSSDAESGNPSINSDGTRITFQSRGNLTGQNGDGSNEIFVFDSKNRDNRLVVAGGPGTVPQAIGFRPPGNQDFALNPFPGFVGGVRTAQGDVNGDGVPDHIFAAGPGGGPHIKVFDGKTLAELRNYFAFEPTFTGGLFVASGDINRDGRDDVIVGADAGGGPRVTVFSGRDGAVLRDFFAYSPAFPGGVRVAAGDTNGDGFSEIIVGAGPGGGPHIKVFSGTSNAELASFFAFAPSFLGGVFVSGGDLNRDGLADIVVGAGGLGGPHIRAFNGLDVANELVNFFAYSPLFTGGVRVSAVDVNGDVVPEIVTGAGPTGGPHVKVFDAVTEAIQDSFFAYDPSVTSGIFVELGH